MNPLQRIPGILLMLSLGANSLPAAAHVTVAPAAAPAGAYQTLAFKVGHGCEGSATTSIAVQLPEAVTGAKPMPKPGWTIALTEAKLALPVQSHGKTIASAVREIAWRGGPLPDAYYDEFVIQVKLPDAPGRYAFKVVQQCEQGRNEWIETAASGAGKFPAPVLEVTGGAAPQPAAPAAAAPVQAPEHAHHH